MAFARLTRVLFSELWMLSMACELQLTSYAKINLTLEVSGKRENGYHNIDSVVQVIDIADDLTLTGAQGDVIEVKVNAPGVPEGKGNIVYRACEEFFRVAGINAGVRVRLEKHIPVQAGLGGGSGNAAAAIAGLNRLYGCGLSVEELSRIGAAVGSDVPLFLAGGTVRMQGRGEIISLLPDAPELSLVVVKPNVGVSTAWAYAELDKYPRSIIGTVSGNAEAAVRENDRGRLLDALQNDFDPVVSKAFPEIAAVKELLIEAGAEAAMVSGSGSAVFGVFSSMKDSQKAAQIIGGMYPAVYVCSSLQRNKSSLV